VVLFTAVPVLPYRKYVLTSRPHHNAELQRWIPSASVAWQGKIKLHYDKLKDLADTFQTEEEALAFGFIAARAWIDEHQPD
jgi:hypothetical protein